MPNLEAHEHSLILHQPQSLEIIGEAWEQAVARFGAECDVCLVGWWQEQVHGHIVYPTATCLITGGDDSWLLTENRGHRVRPLTNNQNAVCAVEFVPFGKSPSLRYGRSALERGSP